MAVARIKLLRNKREVVIRQMRRDIAMLLESGQDATARIRVIYLPLLDFAFQLSCSVCCFSRLFLGEWKQDLSFRTFSPIGENLRTF